MEVYFTDGAFEDLRLLGALHSVTLPDGLLLGHKRGPRFIVERMLPTQKGFFPSRRKLMDLIAALEERLIGFYSFRGLGAGSKKLLHPLGYGKLFLSLKADGNERVSIEPFVIEFETGFRFSPVRVKSKP